MKNYVARRWLKGKVPDDDVDRLKLAGKRAKSMPLSDKAQKRVDEIIAEWFQINQMAVALGINLTKHDYREFMLRRMGVKL